jgi:hypothetical protein
LDISLVSPAGTRVELSSDNGGQGNDYGLSGLWSRFDDESIAYRVATGSAPFPGTYSPEQSLSAFDGESSLGIWTLEVRDDAAQDVGTLEQFALVVATPPVLRWDGNGRGNWTDDRWGANGLFPTASDVGVIVNNKVTVSGDQAAIRVIVESGALDVEDGATITTRQVRVDPAGALSGAGSIVGDVRNSGLVALGTAGDTLETAGNYTQTAGALLRVDFAGSATGQLVVLGTAILDGTLEVTLAAGFVPSAGMAVGLVTAVNGVVGSFATELLPASAGGLSFQLVYHSDAVNLLVMGLAGDYNLDGTVDAADYIVWRRTLGQSGPGRAADGDMNGMVDATDFAIWRSNFGATSTHPAANATIAEPVSSLLAVVCLAIALLIQSRTPRLSPPMVQRFRGISDPK